MKTKLENFFEEFYEKYSDSSVLKKRTEKEEKDLYEKGYSAYEAGDYKEAVAAFESLLLSRPNESAYWQALGSARQMEKDYEKALYAWAMATVLDPENPSFPFHAAECCFSNNDPQEGLKALNIVKSITDEDHELHKKALILEERWDNG